MPGLPGNGEWLPGSGRLTGDIRKYKYKKWLKRNPNASRIKRSMALERIYGAIPDRSRVKKYR